MARINDSPRHCYRRKQWAKPSHLTDLEVFYSVLALLGACIWKIGLWFQCYEHLPMLRHLFEHIWIVVKRILNDIHSRCFCSKCSNFLKIFRSKTSIKIAWNKPNDMLSSLATSLILIRRLSKIIFFTASMFSTFVNVPGWLGRVWSLTSSQPSFNRLYRYWTCVLLLVRLDRSDSFDNTKLT